MQFTLIRHGKADATASPDHRVRPLSEEGKAQAAARREKLGNPQFDLVCHSILGRTRETAMIIAEPKSGTLVVAVSGLFYEERDLRGEAIDRLYSKLGAATPREYMSEAEDEITSLANETVNAIYDEIAQTGALNVLVVGHGILIQALARALTKLDEPFMSCVCGECEGFRIRLDHYHNNEVLEIEQLN